MRPTAVVLVLLILALAALLSERAVGCRPGFGFRLHHPTRARSPAMSPPPELIERCRALQASGALVDPQGHARSQ
jgi:hypothetical protein